MTPDVFQGQTTPGTPVAVVSVATKCAQIWVTNLSPTQVLSVGVLGLNRATGANQIALLPPTQSGATPEWAILKMPPDSISEDPYNLNDYFFDSATASPFNVIAWIL